MDKLVCVDIKIKKLFIMYNLLIFISGSVTYALFSTAFSKGLFLSAGFSFLIIYPPAPVLPVYLNINPIRI